MERLIFRAPEYAADGSFEERDFVYQGDAAQGWEIQRDGRLFLELGPGFSPLRGGYCGVCSTDLARRFLPHPLPQIIGHEVLGYAADRPVVVDINATHLTRAVDTGDCPFCSQRLHSQCPDRITLGINKLPGGFAPWLLAPRRGILPLPEGVSPRAATLVEPFAAALHGVESETIRDGDRVAVLGPRRLGLLVIAALNGVRLRRSGRFSITALARHRSMLRAALRLGADETVLLTADGEVKGDFDLVFDTTGSPRGLETALTLTRRVLHLKSTHGRRVLGMDRLTQLVVDEMALLPFREAFFRRLKPANPHGRFHVLVMPGVSKRWLRRLRTFLPDARVFVPAELTSLWPLPVAAETAGGLPRYDLALVSSPLEADRVIRPKHDASFSPLRPRGAIFFCPEKDASDSPLWQAVVDRGVSLHSSRCGDFGRALKLLEQQPRLAALLEATMISHCFRLSQIETAFALAADSRRAFKVILKTAPD